MPADTIVGYAIVGAGILFVLGLVFGITSHQYAAGARPHPPAGVHLPNPSLLPFIFSIGAALLGAGLALHTIGIFLYGLAAVFVLSWIIPAPYEVEGRGEVQPRVRRQVFATDDAVVEEKVWMVKATIQSMINKGLKERKGIFW